MEEIIDLLIRELILSWAVYILMLRILHKEFCSAKTRFARPANRCPRNLIRFWNHGGINSAKSLYAKMEIPMRRRRATVSNSRCGAWA